MPRLTRTIPTIRRTSQRLTWRPGVNQRTTRGFIRKGATGAPSLAQHFLNSFPARFVTSIERYADAQLGLMTHALHYGTGVFEGIRGYWSSEHEQLFILKLREHYARLQRSVKVLKLKITISLDELCKTSIELA